MAGKRNDVKIKPMDEWGVKEWETAYAMISKKYERLRACMRRSMQHLNQAI